MSTSKSYQDLLVWQKAMDLAESIYTLTRTFPQEERFGLQSQMRRAVVSIPSNIAEGQSRNTVGEFYQFIGVAKGSLAELETQLIICQRIGVLTEEASSAALVNTIELGKILNGLQRSLKPNSQ